MLLYPLTPVPLSLLNGAMHRTAKCALMDKLEPMGTTNAQPDTSSDVCLIDTMFFLRTLPSLPATFGGLAKTILKHACSFAATVHIVCDTYEQGHQSRTTSTRNVGTH